MVRFPRPMPYRPMAEAQERISAARAAGRLPDIMLLLEHTPVVTLGCRGRSHNVLVDSDELARRGIALERSTRGGEVTFHGPGQLVLYPVLRLGEREADAHGYLHNLEEIAIRTAADFGVRAHRRAGMSGAWTDAGKLAAIGFRLKRWITQHGMSFNVSVDLQGFGTIVPCGLHGEPVTSLQILLGTAPDLADVRDRLAAHAEQVLGRRLLRYTPDDAPAALRELLPA